MWDVHGLEQDSGCELCFILFLFKINYLIVYPYAGCQSGQQTALLPLLSTPPASLVLSPVTAICLYMCHQWLHVTHSGAWRHSAP